MHADMLRDPSMGGMVQHLTLTPLFTKLRFAMWDDVLAEPLPPQDLPYMQAISRAARSIAYSGNGRFEEAEKELAAVMAAKSDATLKTLYISSVNVGIGRGGHRLRSRGRRTAGAAEACRRGSEAFQAAVAMEDKLTYMEPPDWPIPVRQLQGAALLALGRAAEAEAAFRGDLKKFPNNGWSLSGLLESRIKQGRERDGEIGTLEIQLGQAWRRADVKLDAGRVVP